MLQPNTIAKELNNDLELLLKSGTQYTQDDASLGRLEHQAKQLSKANPKDGYLILAAASMLKGNFNEMRERYKIACNQGLSAGQKINYATTLSHAGFFSEAAPLVKGAASTFSTPFFLVLKAALCFQFRFATEIFDRAISQNLTPSESDIDVRSQFGDVTRIAGVDDMVLAQLADLAGEVMREHHVFFKNFPKLSFSSNDNGIEFVIASFPVPTSFEDASEMTLSFAEKMIANGIKTENFFIRFCGEV